MPRREEGPPRYIRCALMFQRGMSQKEIAEHFGISPSAVGNYIYLARKRGAIPEKPVPAEPGAHLRPPFGALRSLWVSLDEPTQDWLREQVPPGGVLIDVLRGLIVDAKADDDEKRPPEYGA